MDWNCYINTKWKTEVNVTIKKDVILPFDMPECDKHFNHVFGKLASQSICATIEKRTK